MKVNAIVYTSNTGYTRRYAEMLGEKTGLPVRDIDGKKLPARGMKVLYLGWVMAGSVKGLSRAKKLWNVKGVCAVGMSPPTGQEGPVKKKNPGTEAFYLRGGYDHGRLSGTPKKMMNVLSAVLKLKPDAPASKVILDAVANGGDWVSEEQLAPVLDWLKD